MWHQRSRENDPYHMPVRCIGKRTQFCYTEQKPPHTYPMTLSSRLGLGLLALSIPIMVMAAPDNVMGITATLETGNVRVSWQPAAGAVASYRIFFSHASILGNNGLFDDYETVDGTVHTHVLRNLPQTEQLFVSVLAVDTTGEESAYFVEEATVALAPSSRPTLDAEPSIAPSEPNTTEALSFLKAEASSATGVVLTFSHMIRLEPSLALESVIVETATGTRLRLQRITASGTLLLMETVPQTPGTIYRVRLGKGITGTDLSGASLPLSAETTPMLFTAFGHVLPQTPTIPQPQPSSAPIGPARSDDVTGLTLRAQPSTTLFTIEANWIAPAQSITGYEVRQSIDGGRSFGQVMNIPVDSTAIRIPSVTPGTFGLQVRAVQPDGTRTQGMTQFIDLPGSVLGPRPLTGQVQPPVTTSTGGSGSLPGSGPGLWFLITLAGSLVGLITLRRRMRPVAVRV